MKGYELYTVKGLVKNIETEIDEIKMCIITEEEGFVNFEKFCKEYEFPISMPCVDDRDLTECFLLTLTNNGGLRFVAVPYSSVVALLNKKGE